jgi:hypothetical protein
VPAPRSELRARRERWVDGTAMGLALLPVVAILVTRIGSDWFPLGDDASIDLRVRDVFTSAIPLVGPFSHGFNHPGPLAFWVLAPLSALTGGAPWSILIGGALVQGAAIAGSGWLALRRGGVVLMVLVLGGLGLAYVGLPPGNPFIGAWNPNLAFPFFMLFLLQAWSFALGWRWQLLGAAVTATLLVQFHISYAPLIAAAAVWAVAVVLWGQLRGAPARVPDDLSPDQPSYPRVLAVTVGVTFLLWLAPIVQQLVSNPGNFGLIVRYFRTGGGTTIGQWKAAGLFAAEFAWRPPWLGGSDRLLFGLSETASTVWLLVPIALLAVGFFAAHRSGRVADRRLLELAGITAIASVVAMSRVDLELFPYLFLWRDTAAVFIVVATLWAVYHGLNVEAHEVGHWAVVGIGLVTIALSFGSVARGIIDASGDLGPIDGQARALATRLAQRDHDGTPVQIRGYGATSGVTQGLIDALDRKGVPVRVDPQFADQYGKQRTAPLRDVDEIWYVTAEGRGRDVLLSMPGARLVAYDSVLPPRTDREMDALQHEIRDQLDAAGRPDLDKWLENPYVALILEHEQVPGLDAAAARRLAVLNARLQRSGGCRCAVVAFPADTPPGVPYHLGF